MASASEDYYIPHGVNRSEFLRDHIPIGREKIHAASSKGTELPRILRFDIRRLSHNSIEFDLIGVDASIANALRRILLAEIPTMAIETVTIEMNTGCMQDEVLAHRLGLIPVVADPTKFFPRLPNEDHTDANAIVFSLDVTCKRLTGVSKTAPREEALSHYKVLASDLIWLPQGSQLEDHADSTIRLAYPNIVVTKLAANQSIKLMAIAVKGIGRDHAKFSPVATASYRLLSKIQILRDIENKDAYEFKDYFAKGVIGIRQGSNGNEIAYVADERRDTVSREVYRHPKFDGSVSLSRIRDHFIFLVESTGVIAPATLITRAISILEQKCSALLRCLDKIDDFQ